jgi:hypothetical protein
MVAGQLKLPGDIWSDYGQRAETRREHESRQGFMSKTAEIYLSLCFE